MKENINDFWNQIKNKDKNVKANMLGETITNLLILIFLKVPFDLVRDYGYDKYPILYTKYYYTWNTIFIMLYAIGLFLMAYYMIKRFLKKYDIKKGS